jgi:lipoyl-dependent peroxiredoxin
LAVLLILSPSGKKGTLTKAKIVCEVSIGRREGGGFALAVRLRVEDKNLSQAELVALAKDSHATRGNIDVELEVAAV